MQLKIGDMELMIEKSWYNKSSVSEDGITHIIDTDHRYPYYQFGMGKNYIDIASKKDMLTCLIADLKMVTSELEKHLEKEIEATQKSKEMGK